MKNLRQEQLPNADSEVPSTIARIVLCMNFGDIYNIGSDKEVQREIKDEIISYLEEEESHRVVLCGDRWGGIARLHEGIFAYVATRGLADRLLRCKSVISDKALECVENSRWYWLGEDIDKLIESELWTQATKERSEVAMQILERMTIIVSSWFMLLAFGRITGNTMRRCQECLLSILDYNHFRFEQRWSLGDMKKISRKWLESRIPLNHSVCASCEGFSRALQSQAAWQICNSAKKPLYWLTYCEKTRNRIIMVVENGRSEFLLSDSPGDSAGRCPYYLEHCVLSGNRQTDAS